MREHASRAGGFDHGIRHPVAVQLRLQQIPDVHGHDAGHERVTCVFYNGYTEASMSCDWAHADGADKVED